MQALQGSVIQRNDVTDPSTSRNDLNAAISIPITVRVAANPVGSGALASITDINGTPVSNPTATDNNGNYLVYASDGAYDVIANEGLTNETVEAGVGVGLGTSIVASYGYIKALSGISFSDGEQCSITGYLQSSYLGGGIFTYDSARDKADHDGGTIIAPEAIVAWDGTQANLSQILSWTGSGSGCFVREITSDRCIPEWFGAVRDGVLSDSVAWQAAIDSRFEAFAGSSGVYYIDNRGMTVGNKINFDLLNAGETTHYKLDNALSKTAFTNSLFFAGDGTPVTEYYKVVGGYYYVDGDNDVNTGVQALETKGVSITIIKDVKTRNLSQFAIACSHYDDAEYELVQIENVIILNHGSSTKTGPQVGLELHESDTVTTNVTNVKRKVLKNITVEMRGGVQGSIMKMGSAWEIFTENITLRALNRKGTSGGLEIGGYYTNLVRFDLFINNLTIEDLGANERSPMFFGGPINGYYKNINIQSGTQKFIQWDAQGSTLTRYAKFDTVNLHDCEIRTSSSVNLDNEGVVLNLEIVDGVDVRVNPRQQDGRPITEIKARDTHFTYIYTDVGIHNVNLTNCNVDYFRVFNNSVVFNALSYIFTDTNILKYNHDNAIVGSTIDAVEFNGGSVGDGAGGRLRFRDNNGDGAIPKVIKLNGTTILLGDGAQEFVASVRADLYSVILEPVSTTYTSTLMTFRGAPASMYGCNGNRIVSSVICNMVDDFDFNIYGGSYDNIALTPANPLRSNSSNRVHERGVVIQKSFLATRDA